MDGPGDEGDDNGDLDEVDGKTDDEIEQHECDDGGHDQDGNHCEAVKRPDASRLAAWFEHRFSFLGSPRGTGDACLYATAHGGVVTVTP
jgi:hypothetical protein